MSMTEDEAYLLQQALVRIQQLENQLGRWHVNGADSFFQESGFRFGQNVDIGEQGVQIRAPGETVGISWLPDFDPNFDSNTEFPSIVMGGGTPLTGPVEWSVASRASTVDRANFAATSELDDSNATMSARSDDNTASFRVRAMLGASGFYAQLVDTPLWLGVFTSDPAVLEDGMIWYRSDTDKFRVRVNGVTVNLVNTGDADWTDLTDGGATVLHTHAGGSGHTIRENGTDQTARTGLNFIDTSAGAGLITDDAGGDETEVNLSLYLLRADANYIDLTDGGATTLHSHSGSAATSMARTFALIGA